MIRTHYNKHFLQIGGVSALSDFSRQYLIGQIKQANSAVKNISAEYVHFISSGKKLNQAEVNTLKNLLSYGVKYTGLRKGKLALVIPRPGTISPWSSKATDIALNSGLKHIDRIERGVAYYLESPKKVDLKKIAAVIHDRMTESTVEDFEEAKSLFASETPKEVQIIDIQKKGKGGLLRANTALGLALNDEEIEYLHSEYRRLGRNPTDVELMMFAQINSEHCRHKIFNAGWVIDGKKAPKSLFQMIKNTYRKNSGGIISAYTDNAAILSGPEVKKFSPLAATNEYGYQTDQANIVIKAETHNHPTAIAPDPGAATGVGGEIRDEAAAGKGAKSKMGFSGFSVSNLEIPGHVQPWEKSYGKPERISSPLEIMVKGPIGGASFGNEFGRVNLGGYFRTFQQESRGDVWGYHKPLMIAGGLGNISEKQILKDRLRPGDLIVVLGGPAMLIGLGGGAGSSLQSGSSSQELDFASVQRANAEMQRRVQEVISTCASKGSSNPVKSIHDVGAGGLSNAIPELLHDSGVGGLIELRDIPSAEPGLSPMEIWCNEAQERFVIGIKPGALGQFKKICGREKCPFAIVGKATKEDELIIRDKKFKVTPVNLPMSTLFGSPPKLTKNIRKKKNEIRNKEKIGFKDIDINEAVKRVLHMPAVASKKFLITIGDRTVGGMSVRDQMAGPWQVPVSNLAVTASSFTGKTGEAMAVGERTPLALINAPASARMAVGEAITNIAPAAIRSISDIKLSANWMAASGHKNEDQHLFETVKAIGEDFCPKLGMTIPVGKDSLSMRSSWEENGQKKSVVSPVSLVVSAFAPISGTSLTLTPMLNRDKKTSLIFIDLGQGKNRLGMSALAQSFNVTGGETPDADEPELLKKFFEAIQQLNRQKALLAYHDRSDGGLFAALVEMAFAGRCGLEIDISRLPGENLAKLFSEELGAVIEVSADNEQAVYKNLKRSLGKIIYKIGKPAKTQQIKIFSGKKIIYRADRAELEKWWDETSFRIKSIRDNPALSREEHLHINDDKDPGISPKVMFAVKTPRLKTKPRVAVLREQGINGQVEMAAAFDGAGFRAYDVHMSDLLKNKIKLSNFKGIAAGGGFSYGDVLGGGGGWAKTILFNTHLREQFKEFFARPDTFSLGVCNGCQMFSQLKSLIPGAEFWPSFLRNTSEQFEARLVSVKINPSPSIFFKGMENSILPVPTAHGEGNAVFEKNSLAKNALDSKLVPMQYVNNHGKISEEYPFNPNGSEHGITSLTTPDGRATILMPHPERVFLTDRLSWHPAGWGEKSPWMQLFNNAREWAG